MLVKVVAKIQTLKLVELCLNRGELWSKGPDTPNQQSAVEGHLSP